MDYGTYQFTVEELVQNMALFLALNGAVSYLFYRSVIPFVLGMALCPSFLKLRREAYKKRRQRELAKQFLDGMKAVSASLGAGYSIETSFGDAVKELKQIYTREAVIIKEFEYILAQLHMNRNLEELLSGLAYRSGIEDIQNFADIFAAAKRTGGNLIAIIRNTIQCIGQKEETRLEIETCLSSKKLEQNIMSLVPVFILVYIQMISPGFLDPMYHNALGIVIMTICLLLYGAAWYWGRKIVSIEV